MMMMRNKAEQLGLAMKIAEHIFHDITVSVPPALEDIVARYDVDRHTVHRMIALFAKEFGEDHPHVAETVTSWLASLRASPEEQERIALVIRDMLSAPGTWGIRSVQDLAEATGIPVRRCKSYYAKHWQPDWPAMPQRDRGWVSQEAARAAELGDIEALRSINAEQDSLVEMRESLVRQRVKEFDEQPTTQGGET